MIMFHDYYNQQWLIVSTVLLLCSMPPNPPAYSVNKMIMSWSTFMIPWYITRCSAPTTNTFSEQAMLLSTERDSQDRLRLLTVIGYVAYTSIGVINQRINGLSIDFHDAAVHHSMNRTNESGHTMGGLSVQSVLLSTERDPGY